MDNNLFNESIDSHKDPGQNTGGTVNGLYLMLLQKGELSPVTIDSFIYRE